jgi:hypothetical protein
MPAFTGYHIIKLLSMFSTGQRDKSNSSVVTTLAWSQIKCNTSISLIVKSHLSKTPVTTEEEIQSIYPVCYLASISYPPAKKKLVLPA